MRLQDLIIPFVGDSSGVDNELAQLGGKLKGFGKQLESAFGGFGDLLKESLAAADTDGAFAEATAGLESATEGIKADIGADLLPLAIAFVDALQGLIDAWNNLSPATQEGLAIFIGLMGLFAVLAPVIVTIGTALAALSAPVIIAVVVIGALIAIGWSLYKNWDKIMAYFKGLWDGWMLQVEISKQAWLDFKDDLIQLWEDIKESIRKAIDGIRGFFKNLIPDIEIPEWLKKFMPGSPSPFELSIKGIDRAVNDLDLQAKLAGGSGLGPGSGLPGQTNDEELRRLVRQLPGAIAEELVPALQTRPTR